MPVRRGISDVKSWDFSALASLKADGTIEYVQEDPIAVIAGRHLLRPKENVYVAPASKTAFVSWAL